MNFGESKAEIFRRLGESSGAPVFWSEADVEAAYNEGYRDFAEKTRMCERSAEVRVTKGVPYADARSLLGYPFLGLRRVYSRLWNGPVRTTSIKHVDSIVPRWAFAAGAIRRVMVRGLYVLGFWPPPDSNESLKVSWTSLPDPLVNDSDVPEIPESWHEAPIHYACYDLKIQEDETADAFESWDEYLKLVEEAKKEPADLIKPSRQFIMGGPRQGIRSVGVRVAG